VKEMKEIYSVRRRQMSVSVSQSRIDSVRSKDITRTGLRIYRDGRLGIAGAIGDYDRAKLEVRAIASLSPGVEYPWEPSKDLVLQKEYPAATIPEASFADEAEAVLSKLREAQPGLIFSNNIQQDSTVQTLENEAGLKLSCSTSSFSILLSFKEEKSTGIIDGDVSVADSRSYDRGAALREMLEFCEAYWNRIDLPSGGKLPVIYPRLGLELLFGRLPWELSGRAYGTGASLLTGKIGQKVFGDRFSLTQCNDPAAHEDCFFDVEGVVNEGFRYPLIEGGVLRAVYTDRRIAARYGLPHTGSAVGGFDSVPSIGCVGLEVEESGKTLAELLEGRPGVFVAMAAGGDYTPDGRFATPVQLAMLHDGIRFVGRLPELQISSHLFTMFGDDFVGLSSDSFSELSDNRCLVAVMDVEKM
jgi:PmbA protein